MISPVVIKGNKAGIRIILSEDAFWEEILTSLEEKLSLTKEYYTSHKPITVTFEGKNLTEDEKNAVIETLRKKGINAGYLHKETEDRSKRKKQNQDKLQHVQTNKTGLFYIGNLKNGQSITAMTSIVIVGDVEAGATVESTGNIVVIGRADGSLNAGHTGNPNTFVYSLNNK